MMSFERSATPVLLALDENLSWLDAER